MIVKQFINTEFKAGDLVRLFSGDEVGEVFAASRLGVTVVWPSGKRTANVAGDLMRVGREVQV